MKQADLCQIELSKGVFTSMTSVGEAGGDHLKKMECMKEIEDHLTMVE